MNKYVIGVALAAAVAVGVTLAAVSSDDTVPTAAASSSVQPVTADGASVDGDDIQNDGALGDQGETEDVPAVEGQIELEVEEDVSTTRTEPPRSAFLGDLRNFIEGRSTDLGETVVDLTDLRATGTDVTPEIGAFVDGITVFGEAVVNGVAITPDTLAAVPDLREIHQGLITGIDELHTAASALDPSAGDAAWAEATSEVLSALDSLATFLAQAR